MFRAFYEKYLIVVFWPALLILISWGTYYYISLPEDVSWSDLNGENGQDGMDNVPFRATKPRLVERSEDGLVRWELWSESLDGVIGGGGELTRLEVRFTFPDASVLTINADRGSYLEDDKYLEVSGNVTGYYPSGEMSFTCDAVDYSQREQSLAMSGDVNVHAEREGLKIACPEVIADLSKDLSYVEFMGGVAVDMYKIR
jgi:hypothetical protein